MEAKTKKNLILSVLGIILVTLLVLKFGIPLLINLSLFLSGGSKKEQLQSKNPSFIASPILNSLPSATSSAIISVSGIASENQIINLYINDNLVDETKTDDNGSFSSEGLLNSGENTIKAKAVVDPSTSSGQVKESEFSQPITVVFKSAPPGLNIISPSDGQSFKDQNTIDIQGTTDQDVRITVNGFWAITDNNGSFSYRLPLQNGENKIKIIATDIAGNKAEKEIKVTYSP